MLYNHKNLFGVLSNTKVLLRLNQSGRTVYFSGVVKVNDKECLDQDN